MMKVLTDPSVMSHLNFCRYLKNSESREASSLKRSIVCFFMMKKSGCDDVSVGVAMGLILLPTLQLPL